MKKNNKKSLYETIQQMPMAGGPQAQQMGGGMQMAPNAPINGVSYTPDGKGDMIPAPIDYQAMNRARSQTPINMAASMSQMSANAGTAPVDEEEPVEDQEEEEVEEGEEEEVEEVEEAFKAKFKNSIMNLLGESNVSSELVEQLEAVFEAAVQDRVERNVSVVLEEVDANVKNYLSNVTNNLVEKVDDYLEYVVEEWMTDNAVAVEQGIKTQIAENFIGGLKNLFENHYIDVPAEKYNVLDELYAQNKELQVALNQSINENINLKKEVSLTECAGVFVAETRDLADTQIAKLQSLMENVSFNSVDEYRNKLTSIKNNYLTSARPAAPKKVITEEQTFSRVNEVPGTLVENYVSALGRLNKKV
jgi:hypothetical protein